MCRTERRTVYSNNSVGRSSDPIRFDSIYSFVFACFHSKRKNIVPYCTTGRCSSVVQFLVTLGTYFTFHYFFCSVLFFVSSDLDNEPILCSFFSRHAEQHNTPQHNTLSNGLRRIFFFSFVRSFVTNYYSFCESSTYHFSPPHQSHRARAHTPRV